MYWIVRSWLSVYGSSALVIDEQDVQRRLIALGEQSSSPAPTRSASRIATKNARCRLAPGEVAEPFGSDSAGKVFAK